MVSKSMTFDGATTNDPGDLTGTGNPATLFTVTGSVLAEVFGVVGTSLGGATATVAVGVAGNTGAVIATTTATDLDAGMGWDDNGPALGEQHVIGTAVILGAGLDIIQTVATADVTSGQITYYCFWRPLSSDGNVVAA